MDFLQQLDPWELLVQSFGLLATIFGILSFQQKTQKGIVLFQLVNHVLWSTHFFLLGAYAGGILNVIGIVRCAVFSQRGEKCWARSPWWYALFGISIIAASVFAFCAGDGGMALFPMSAMLLTTFSLSLSNPFSVRALTFFSSPFWLVYNIINRSIFGICTEIFAMISIIVGICRHDLPRLKARNRK